MDCKKVENFLFLKKRYNNILIYLTEIMSSYEEVYNYNNDELFIIQYNKYKQEFFDIKCIIDDINNKMYKICKHEFVQDEIDINPEKTQRIEYCKICEYTNDTI